MSAFRNFVYGTVGPFVGMAVLVVGIAGSQKLNDFQASGLGDAIQFVPVALGLLMVGYLIRGRDRPFFGRVRGTIALPFVVVGYAVIAAVVASVAAGAFGQSI